MLAGASVSGPYVLVGASHGGYMTMSYAHYYPSETAGLGFRTLDRAMGLRRRENIY